MAAPIIPRLEAALAVLLPAQDVLEERVDDVEPPAWCERRGWTSFLLGLSEAELEHCEAEGLAACLASFGERVPPSLGLLAADTGQVVELGHLAEPRVEPTARALRSVGGRKQAQLGALLGALTPMASAATRIVDVGAGSGHFTRLAAAEFEREVLGIEISEQRVERAAKRAGREASFRSATDAHPAIGPRARFVTADAVRGGLAFAEGDLAIGLHACGELGDGLVRAAAQAGCDVALVSCCLQKISSPKRLPLSRTAGSLFLPRELLGLSNLTAQPRGVETPMPEMLRAREVRYSLRRLLAARGVVLAPGAEMTGLNRRRAHAGLADLAERAFARRGLLPPSTLEVEHHEHEAHARYGIVRRLGLPRSMLARLVEMTIALDRAAHLHEHGYHVQLGLVFARAVSPRNIGLFASRQLQRLPSVRDFCS